MRWRNVRCSSVRQLQRPLPLLTEVLPLATTTNVSGPGRWRACADRAAGALAIDGLLRAMHGTNVELRLRIIAALAAIGGAADKVVPSLERALEQNDPAVRRKVVKALACYGPAAAPALPALIALRGMTSTRRSAAWPAPP